MSIGLSATVACAVAYFGFTKPQVAGLVAAATGLILLVYQGLEVLNLKGKSVFFVSVCAVLSFLWVLSSSLPAHALLDNVETALIEVFDGSDASDQIEAGVMAFFTILDIFIIFVLIGSVCICYLSRESIERYPTDPFRNCLRCWRDYGD